MSFRWLLSTLLIALYGFASSGKKGSGDSLAALNKLLVALSDDEKTAPELGFDN